jgi:murein DD-endopeptidase MepM/ murein hydrolase activator NlpD
MSGKWRRGVTILVQQDGTLKTSTYRLPLWLLRLFLAGTVAFVVLLVLGAAFIGPVARQAARVPGMAREVERLRTENQRVRELAVALDSVEAGFNRLRGMLGADILPEPVAVAPSPGLAPAVPARLPGSPPRYEDGPSSPSHWPLEVRGYITRGQVGAGGREEAHPGVDIAVPPGTLVRAAGGGIVLQTGEHEEYGLFVLLEHPNGYQSMYGHLSRITAVQGARIQAGEVLGRSGNTGRSSAPHLHFEIRQNGVSIDPTTLVKEVP